MLNSVAAGRRLARRVVLAQSAATLIAAMAGLPFGHRVALGVLAGGVAIMLGNMLVAWRALSGGVVGAHAAFGKLLSGLALKWMAVVAGAYLAIAVWGLPAPAVVIGMIFAALAAVMTASQA